jgi:DNA invertase Pin-like site-specific DNA recombinase
LQRAGCQKIFKDELPGATTKRPALLRCLKTLQHGDTLTVWKLDRLGRSLRDCGVKFRSLTEAIDTETPTGRVMWLMIGMMAECARAGVKAAKKRGVKFGREPKLTPQQIGHARELIDGGERREDVAALLNVDRTTLYRALAGYPPDPYLWVLTAGLF